MAVFEEEAVELDADNMPPRMPETVLEVFDGAVEILEADGVLEVVEAPKENVGAAAVALEEVEDEVAAGAGEAAGLAAPKPVKPPKGLAFAGGCEAALVVEAPKLKVGVDVAGAVDEEEAEVLPDPVLLLPPKLAKGLVPPDAPNGEDDAAAAAPPKGAGLPVVDPGVPGRPLRLGRPRITLPAVGVAGIEPCEDGESSSEPSSPSSRRICFSACRFISCTWSVALI